MRDANALPGATSGGLPGATSRGLPRATSSGLALQASTRATDFAALAKPRLNFLVIVSALAGYAMGGGDMGDVLRVLGTVIGTGLVAGGASGFNQIIERDADGLMNRTRLRPLPDGRLQRGEALVFASILSTLGLFMLAAAVNVLTAFVAIATLASYAVVYTPMKRRSSFSTVVGAVPGALPPVIGWAAAQNAVTAPAAVLFGIVFLWQLPHFLAIAWIYREDYARAGFPMLPVLEPDGRSTARQAVLYAAALLPLSLAPALIGMAGKAYFAGALGLGLIFVWLALQFARSRSIADARRLFFGSIIYLPLLWVLMITDRV